MSTAQVRAEDRHDDPARFMVAVDFDYADAISSTLVDNGAGGGLRLGHEFDALLVTMIPEVEFNYHSYDNGNATTFSGLVGGRLRFLKILEPGIFAHAGAGHIGGDDPHTGFALNLGLTLDLTVLPLVDIGLHTAWNRIFNGETHPGLSWSTFGAHVALVL